MHPKKQNKTIPRCNAGQARTEKRQFLLAGILLLWIAGCMGLSSTAQTTVRVGVYNNPPKVEIGEDGTITIRLDHDRGVPRLTIRDSGGGISEEARKHLFTPFFTSKENGQGLGLTMVQEILLAHGFDFSLESDEDGFTSFTILFQESGEPGGRGA